MKLRAFASFLLLFIFPFPGSSQFLDSACGIRSKTKTIYGSNPWMVYLVPTNGSFVCGGTLITKKLVLTAAQCIISNLKLVARLGEYQGTPDEKCSSCYFRAEHRVDAAFRTRFFNPNSLVNDIAILRLAKSVVYTDNIKPICIVWDTKWRQYINSIEVLSATGWGSSMFAEASDELRTLDIRRQEPEVCSQFIGPNITAKQFCVGNWDTGLCNGDCGGPLGAIVTHNNTQRFIQIGITSYTNSACEKASVSTDVLSHIDFILQVWRQYGDGQSLPNLGKTPTPDQQGVKEGIKWTQGPYFQYSIW